MGEPFMIGFDFFLRQKTIPGR